MCMRGRNVWYDVRSETGANDRYGRTAYEVKARALRSFLASSLCASQGSHKTVGEGEEKWTPYALVRLVSSWKCGIGISIWDYVNSSRPTLNNEIIWGAHYSLRCHNKKCLPAVLRNVVLARYGCTRPDYSNWVVISYSKDLSGVLWDLEWKRCVRNVTLSLYVGVLDGCCRFICRACIYAGEE